MPAKFATQFIRIFSAPVAMPIVDEVDGDLGDAETPVAGAVLTDREYERRVRWYNRQAELHAEVDAARRRWQELERAAMLAKFEYIDAYSRIDPDLVTRHETGKSA